MREIYEVFQYIDDAPMAVMMLSSLGSGQNAGMIHRRTIQRKTVYLDAKKSAMEVRHSLATRVVRRKRRGKGWLGRRRGALEVALRALQKETHTQRNA